MAAVMMSALVDACVVFIALDVGWIASLGAALAGRVGQAWWILIWRKASRTAMI